MPTQTLTIASDGSLSLKIGSSPIPTEPQLLEDGDVFRISVTPVSRRTITVAPR